MRFYVLLVFALSLRVLSEVNYPILTSDDSIQIEVAKNFHQSGNFTLAWVESKDLSKIQLEPLKLWPVGLSIVVYLLNFLTNNLINAKIIFQCIGALLFVFGILKVLKQLNVSSHIINLFLLLFAFNSSPFLYLGSTDLVTAALFVWVVYFTIKELNCDNSSILNVFFISILSFFAAALRFACIPNLVIIPLVFVLAWMITKNKKSLINAFLILLLGSFFTFLFYKFFPFSSGRTSFITNIKTGTFYFSHLKWFDPFTLKAFFYTKPVEFRLPNNPTVLFLYRTCLLVGSILFLVFIMEVFIIRLNFIAWIKKLYKQKIKNYDSLILIFICSFAVITSFIALQSITSLPEKNSFGPSWMPYFWTFVYSTRYFIYLMALLIILFFVAYHKQQSKQDGNTWVFKIIYGMSLFWSIVYWSFSQYQFYSPNGNGAGSEWVNKANSIATFNIINDIHASEPNTHIVFAHYKNLHKEGLVTNYAYAYPTDAYTDIINGNFANSSKLTLIMAMPDNLSNIELAFLERYKHTVLSTFKSEKLIKINL